MTNEEIFAAWSPENSLWATWAKPVLFAHLDRACALPPSAETARDVVWSPATDQKFALVLDLPGEEGVWLGVALAGRGYRPMPLYNAWVHDAKVTFEATPRVGWKGMWNY